MVRRAAWTVFLAAASCPAQPPAIAQNGVVNFASQLPPALAASPIGRGVLFQIQGVRLAAADEATSIRVFRDAKSITIKPVSVDSRHIEAVMPEDAPLGKVSIGVLVGSRTSLPATAVVVSSNPAIFTRHGTGWGPAAAENIESSGARIANDIDHSALPGQRVAIHLTGRFNVSNDRVLIGGKAAAIVSTRETGPGREETIVRVPRDSPQGCFVPVTLTSAPFRASNFASLSIRSGGGRCGSEDRGDAPLEGPRTGVLILGRTRTDDHGHENLWDEAVAIFAEAPPGPVMAPLAMPPPPGTCTFFAGSYQSGLAVPRSPSSALADEIGGRGLNSGSEIVITGPNANRTITAPTGTPGAFIAKLGGDGGPPPVRPPFFQPGSYGVSALGGPELAPFNITFAAPQEFEWINRDRIATIDRSQPLTVTWRGVGDGQRLAIVVMNVDPSSTAIGTCLCVSHAGAGRFTIPAAALRNLPRGEDHPDPPLNVIELVSVPDRTRMQAFGAGLKSGAAFSVFASAKLVSFR